MAAPSDEPESSADEASRLDTLYNKLSPDIDMMRVLYVLRQGGGWAPYLPEITTAEAREKALNRGLAYRFPWLRNSLFISDEGRQVLRDWMADLDRGLRNDRFQDLLRHVIAWRIHT